ncbi:MAG TPA: FecR domain-containing protein, partial [Candidatus Omnitrophota bacterium]|nr:FecR domain-containing protein [Candidatus Omnitrophota bacterium]
MKMIKKAVGLILAMLLAFPPNVIAETVGTISYIEGRVDRLAKDGKSYLPVAAGEQVSTGDVLRTKSSSKAEITFTDKSVVRMSDGTQIKVSDYLVGQDGYRKNAVIDLERGNVRAIVSKTLDLAPFNINTPNMTGAVKGSDVFVSYQQSSTNILVAEGLFNVKNPSFPDQAIAIKNGMAAMVPYNKPPEEPRTFMDIEKQKYEAVTGPSIRIEGKSKNLEVVRATIIKIEGSTRVQSKGANKWHIPAIGEVLYMGDIVETADKSKVRLAFDNGLSMELQPSTQLLITSLTRNIKTGDYDTSFESKYGKIIAKLQNKPKNSTFVVKTPHAACGIRGTIMYLSIMPDLTRVFFQGGTGNVHSILKNLEKVALEGKVLIIDKDGNIIEQDMTPEDLAGFDSQFGNEGQNEYGYSGGDGVNYGITSIIQNSGFPNPGDLGTDPFDDVKPEPNAEDQDGDGNPDNVPTNLVTSNFEGKYGYYGSFEIDEASVISGNITTTTYVPWGGENQVAVFEGTYDNPNGQSLFFGSVTGSGADGGALVGRFLGANESVYESTSWQGVLSAIYIDST